MNRIFKNRILTSICIAIVIFISSAYYFKLKWTGYESKTLWDWMDLLIVPAMLAIGGLIYNRTEKKTEQKRAQQHAQSEREIARDNQQETVLQTYLSAMTELMLKHELNDAKVKTIAQARTTGVLSRLDINRKLSVLSFLADAGLINAENPTIRLSGADFSNIGPLTLSLYHISLSGINFSGSRLAGSTFSGCDFRYADLSKADLSDCNLFDSNFCASYLSGTIFSKSVIFSADFSEGWPVKASMSERIAKENTQKGAQEWRRNLSEAIFIKAEYDYSTKKPNDFDWEKAGAINTGD